VIEEAEMSPNISGISEDDPRVLRSNFYSPPESFPPLEIHISGQSGESPLFNPGSFTFISAAVCRECVPSEPQGNSAGVGNAAIAERKGKKRRRASSGVQGNLRAKRRAKGKQAEKIFPRKSHCDFYLVLCLSCMPPAQGAAETIATTGLESEVETLKSRCEALERTIREMKSGCDTHESLIESHRVHIVGIQKHLGTLNMSYEGERLELKQ